MQRLSRLAALPRAPRSEFRSWEHRPEGRPRLSEGTSGADPQRWAEGAEPAMVSLGPWSHGVSSFPPEPQGSGRRCCNPGVLRKTDVGASEPRLAGGGTSRKALLYVRCGCPRLPEPRLPFPVSPSHTCSIASRGCDAGRQGH